LCCLTENDQSSAAYRAEFCFRPQPKTGAELSSSNVTLRSWFRAVPAPHRVDRKLTSNPRNWFIFACAILTRPRYLVKHCFAVNVQSLKLVEGKNLSLAGWPRSTGGVDKLIGRLPGAVVNMDHGRAGTLHVHGPQACMT
jgi:hypothetical protein